MNPTGWGFTAYNTEQIKIHKKVGYHLIDSHILLNSTRDSNKTKSKQR